ncbi:uncharacterized protein RJT21DRAFT_28766 [Scheffersomyces amazonensis]|uniref:uncharacterized protein n=1 Tax=Scheffersomyces amazonensis TaxID=1078765 RepID=UPI00315C6EB7
MDSSFLQLFVRKYLFKLPISIYTRILDDLPRGYIYYYVLRIPEDGLNILDWYFNNNEVFFDLDGNGNYSGMSKIYFITSAVTMVQLLQIPEFRPKELLIMLSMSNTAKADLEILIEQLYKLDCPRDIVLRVGNINYLNSPGPTQQQIELFLSFFNVKSLSLINLGEPLNNFEFSLLSRNVFFELKNLQHLHMSRVTVTEGDVKLPPTLIGLTIHDSNISIESLKLPETLTELDIANMRTSTNNGIKLPQRLTFLSIHNTNIPVDTLILPESLKEMTISHNEVTDEQLNFLKWPGKLSYLSLPGNKLTILPLSKFPQTLEGLDASYNQFIDTIDIDDNTRLPNLRVLNMRCCAANFKMLSKLSNNWPSSLEHLEMSKHDLINTLSLTNLTNSIEHKSIPVISRSTKIRFPNSLKYLSIALEELPEKFETPCGVKHLYIVGSGLNIANMKLPLMLQTLHLTGIFVGNIENLHLDKFAELKDLNLTNSGITSIDTWIPPLTLTDVRISHNPIKRLSKDAPLLKCSDLRDLFLDNCEISHVDEDVVLPPKLAMLDLSNNKLSSWHRRFTGVYVEISGNPSSSNIFFETEDN